jgi:hypothetical protein
MLRWIVNFGVTSTLRTAHNRAVGHITVVISFSTSALGVGGLPAPRLGHLYPQERPGSRFTGGWVGPQSGLDVCEKSRPNRDSIPGPSSP